MIKYKRVLVFSMVFAMYSPSIIASALTTVTGYKSINNSSDSSYKTGEDSIKNVINSMNRPSDYKELLNYSPIKGVIDSNKELSYLIENNILSSDLEITYDRTRTTDVIETNEVKRFNYDSSSNIRKSDFLATLSKAVYGVKESRYLVFQSKASREINGKEKPLLISSEYTPEGYEGSDDMFDFSKGDYHLYVTPNVYENYYYTLVNKGIVSLSEFSDIDFINQMSSYGKISDNKTTVPLWDSSLGYYNVSSSNYNYGFNILGKDVLGSGFSLEESDSKALLSLNDVSWFLDEDMLTIDALRYIEKALRASEKEMTKTEAELVNYKYGAMYLDRVDSSSKDTIMYLVAKGILNFENEDEFNSIYKSLSGNMFRTLIYRVSNKDARFNFSSIQLTDSDNYWLSRGYYNNKVNLYSGIAPSFKTNVKEIDSQVSKSKSISNLFGLLKSRDTFINDGPTEYEVERTFVNYLSYTYKGEVLSESTKPEGDIVSVTKDNNVLVVKFKVKATNPTAAIAIVDANMSVTKNSVTSIGSIPAISKVSVGEGFVTYVSQSALRNLSGSPISIANDKYLINKETGSKALLLEDNNIAIVGNEIIKTENNIVTGINNEVYYNFSIISKLLSQAMVSSLDPNSWYVSTNTIGETNYKFVNGKGSELETIYVNQFLTSPVSSTSTKPTYAPFYNITLGNSTSNYLIQNISKDLGYPSEFFNYMVVEFKYVLPTSSDLKVDLSTLFKVNNEELFISSVYNDLYKRPDNNSLASVWDSNLLMSNSIVNYMMGTSGITYVNSGYIVPRVYILSDLYDAGKSHSKEDINKFFLEKVQVPSTLVSSYGSYDKTKLFIENYFNYIGSSPVSSSDSILNSIKKSRTLEVLSFRDLNIKNIGYHDYGKFSVLNTGQVYKNVAYSDDLIVDEAKKTITFKLMSDRQDEIKPMVVYTVEGNTSSITNFITTRVSAFGIADLVGLSPLEFYYNKDSSSSSKLEYKDGSNNSIPANNRVKEVGTLALGDSGFFDVTDINFSGDINFVGELKKDAVYYSEGKFIQVDKDGKKKDLSTSNDADLKLITKSTIYVYPKFQITNSTFAPNSMNELSRNKSNPTLDIGNLVNGGIANQIIDSIVYHTLKYITYDQLPNGSKVYIGDAMYIKEDSFLQSGIINDKGIVDEMLQSNILDEDSATKIKTVVVKTIGNFSLVNKSISGNATFGGTEVPLADYIKVAKFGHGREGERYDNTLMSDKGGSVIVKNLFSSERYTFGVNYSNYCIAFSLDNSIRFRAIDDTNTKFTVIRVINKDSDGFLEKVPFYIESLDYDDMEGLNFDILLEKFKPSDNAHDLMKKFLEAYKLNTQRDLKELAKYWIRVICTVLSAFNLIIMIFRRSPLDVVIRDIKYSASSKYNIDLYTICTFGFQSVDVDMPIWKGVLISGVLVAIASFATIGSF